MLLLRCTIAPTHWLVFLFIATTCTVFFLLRKCHFRNQPTLKKWFRTRNCPQPRKCRRKKPQNFLRGKEISRYEEKVATGQIIPIILWRRKFRAKSSAKKSVLKNSVFLLIYIRAQRKQGRVDRLKDGRIHCSRACRFFFYFFFKFSARWRKKIVSLCSSFVPVFLCSPCDDVMTNLPRKSEIDPFIKFLENFL